MAHPMHVRAFMAHTGQEHGNLALEDFLLALDSPARFISRRVVKLAVPHAMPTKLVMGDIRGGPAH